MESPLKVIRKELKYTQSGIATLANESQGHISEIEKGYVPLGNKIIEFLESIGVDPDKIDQKQSEYMVFVKNQLRQRATIQKGVD